MIRSLFKHELKMMITSKKNLIFLLFLFGLLLSYCYLILPNETTMESFDSVETENELNEINVQQREREKRGSTGILLRTGQAVYADFENYYRIHDNMLTAFRDGDFERFLQLRLLYLSSSMDNYGDPELFMYSPFPVKDRQHLFFNNLLTLKSYIDDEVPISYELIEEKTTLQVLKNLLLTIVTLFIVFCSVYFSNDIILRDRHNRSILQGLPVSWYRLLNIKSGVAFIYSTFVLLLLLIIGIVALSIQNGFGFFNLKMPVMLESADYDLMEPELMTIGKFLLLCASFIPILTFLFIRLNVIFNLLLKNEWVVLAVSSLLLFSESIYFTRTLREIAGIEISYLPQTYFDFGKIITGEKNFLVNLESITYGRGIVVLFITVFVVEILVWLVSRIVNKQRFYRWN